MAYNPIDTQILVDALESAGFTGTKVGKEVVYTRDHHKDSAFRVKVYTSAASGKANVKAKGKDAIRICLTYVLGNGKERGVAKAKRVFRTGTDTAIVTRMKSRMREMYDLANKMAKSAYCPDCNAPRWLDSGKCVACYKKAAAPAPVDLEKEEAEYNAAFAKYEQEQEAAAFLSDPDYVLYATGEL